ncbi:MAG: hypothetical protein JWO38_4146 [Gemmataceae bacterium]|nr:hypothetical protein [Gemmataceae bacterium]
MNHGLELSDVTGRDADEIVARLPETPYRVRLTPDRPSVGASDWRLTDLRLADEVVPPFARVRAEWHAGRPGQPALAGDAASLLRDLRVLHDLRRTRAERIGAEIGRLAGDPPALAERIGLWRQVCDLERDRLQIGVAQIERHPGGYRLVPEEQEEVRQWVDGLESQNPEGLDWARHPLILRSGDEFARLVVRSVDVPPNPGGELILVVACDDPRGRALADRVCDAEAPAVAGPTRLFLPDNQLRLIDDALTLLDPERQPTPPRGGGAGAG